MVVVTAAAAAASAVSVIIIIIIMICKNNNNNNTVHLYTVPKAKKTPCSAASIEQTRLEYSRLKRSLSSAERS